MCEDLGNRHRIVSEHGGYYHNQQRGLVKIKGADRTSWLHNLTTNTISTLGPGDGNYAFAISVQGRVVFDFDCLVFEDHLWIDLDRRQLAGAIAHLSKYRVVEDVELIDISEEWVRYDIIGRDTATCVERLGLGNNFAAYANLQHSTSPVGGQTVHLVKGYLGPVSAAALYVAKSGADSLGASIDTAASKLGMIELDHDLAEMIRIEAGHPASVDDIDGDVIPPETLQVERGISYVKGCYLGQEVIERMRSRDSIAKQLVGMKISGSVLPPKGAWVFADAKQIGRVTSACHSEALGSILAMGYVKTALVEDGGTLRVAINETDLADLEIVDLPLPAWSAPS